MKPAFYRVGLVLLVLTGLLAIPQPVIAATWAVAYTSSVPQIKTLAVYNNKLYAGGMYNNQTNGHIFVFNGIGWSDLDFATRIGISVDLVESMQVYDNFLFIGVRVHEGSNYYARVYRYDENEFYPELSITNTSNQSGIEDLTTHNEELYAAQGIVNGEVFRRVDSTNWTSVGGKFSGGEQVRALASYKGELYSGGGGLAKIRKWNGASWDLVENLSTRFSIGLSIWSLAADGDYLYAGPVGTMAYTPGVIPAFDGVDWTNSLNLIGNVRLANINGQVWAGALDGKIYWNHGSWEQYGALPVYAFDFAVYKGYIYAAGSDGKIYKATYPNSYNVQGTIKDSTAQNSPIEKTRLSLKRTTVPAYSNTEYSFENGEYVFMDLPAGTYKITPIKPGYEFSPGSRTITIPGESIGQDFTGTKSYCALEGIPVFLQGHPSSKDAYPEWWNDTYGHPNNENEAGNTMGRWGCNTTSHAMLVDYLADKNNVDFTTNPKLLNNYLRANSGYSTSDYLDYNAVTKYMEANLNIHYNTIQRTTPSNEQIYTELCQNNPVVLRVPTTNGTHFVLAVGKSKVDGVETFNLHDPIYGDTTLLEHWGTFNKAIYYHTDSLPNLQIHVPPQVQIIAIDPLGRRTGYDPRTATLFQEIPDSFYDFERLANIEGAFKPETRYLFLPNPLQGYYSFQVFGVEAGQYQVELRKTDSAGFLSNELLRGTATTDSVEIFTTDFQFHEYLPILFMPMD